MLNPKLILFVFISVSLLSDGFKSAEAQSSTGKKYNIVYILADDLGYGELGCYGQEKIETPNLDELAKGGMRFTQHYAFPVCAPSRYLLMTGKNSGKAFIRGNHEWGDRGDVWSFKAMEANPYLEGQYPIPDSTITIAKVLKEAGYATALIGKWGLGAPMTTGTPNNQGFDYFYGFMCQRQDHTYYPGHLWENNYRIPLDNRIVDPNVKLDKDLDPLDEKNYEKYQQKDYAPDFLIRAALNFIDNNKDKPFFLYYPSPLPHVSLQAPKDLVAYYHKKFGDEKPFLGGSYFPCRYPRATYAAMITLLDRQIGMIIKKLKEDGLFDNTIIMFCSDNGPSFNQVGVDPNYFKSAGPFNGEYGWGKGFLHEGGIMEPFIVSWPGKVKAGSTSNLISATIDIMPTICDLLGVKVPDEVDGVSILPTLLKRGKQEQHPYLYFEYPEYGGQQSIRLGDWKGIRLNMLKGNAIWSLYNLAADPKEEHDLANEHPEIVKQMDAISKKEHHTPEISRFLIPVLENEKEK